MKLKERITKLRVISVILLSLYPLAMLVLGIWAMFSTTGFNFSFVLAYLLFPIGAILSVFLLTFSNFKLSEKILSVISVLVIFAIAFCIASLLSTIEKFEHYENDDVETHYVNLSSLSDFLDVGSPAKKDLYLYSCEYFIFFNSSDILICQYDDVEYQNQKNMIEETYVFQKDSITNDEYSYEPTAEIDGYSFRMLSIEGEYEKQIDYPKQMILIATNDETREIVYIAFVDRDLDYITSLTDFVYDNCGWKHMN